MSADNKIAFLVVRVPPAVFQQARASSHPHTNPVALRAPSLSQAEPSSSAPEPLVTTSSGPAAHWTFSPGPCVRSHLALGSSSEVTLAYQPDINPDCM